MTAIETFILFYDPELNNWLEISEIFHKLHPDKTGATLIFLPKNGKFKPRLKDVKAWAPSGQMALPGF